MATHPGTLFSIPTYAPTNAALQLGCSVLASDHHTFRQHLRRVQSAVSAVAEPARTVPVGIRRWMLTAKRTTAFREERTIAMITLLLIACMAFIVTRHRQRPLRHRCLSTTLEAPYPSLQSQVRMAGEYLRRIAWPTVQSARHPPPPPAGAIRFPLGNMVRFSSYPTRNGVGCTHSDTLRCRLVVRLDPTRLFSDYPSNAGFAGWLRWSLGIRPAWFAFYS